jgi:hypothetical protein
MYNIGHTHTHTLKEIHQLDRNRNAGKTSLLKKYI